MLKSIATILVAASLTGCTQQPWQINVINRSPSEVQVSFADSAGSANSGVIVRPGQTAKLALDLGGGSRPKISFVADRKGYVFEEAVPQRHGTGEIMWLGNGRLALRKRT